MAHRGELMRPENVEFIAVYGPGGRLLSWHVESRVCRSIGKEDAAVIPAPDLPPILARVSPPRAVRLPDFYIVVVELAGRRFGNRAGDVSRKRLIVTGSFAVVGGFDGVLAEGVDRNIGDGPQQEQTHGNMHGHPERTSGDLCARDIWGVGPLENSIAGPAQ